ncbi:Olfactory Receptor 2L13, partial [Manis pentadactyla]
MHLTGIDSRLHTPGYSLLNQLSLKDRMDSSTSVPKMGFHFLSGWKAISLLVCGLQSCCFLPMACSEGLLLASVACNHYLAVRHPLHYPIRRSKRMCVKIVTGSWVLGSISSPAHTVRALRVPYCHSRAINPFLCNDPPCCLWPAWTPESMSTRVCEHKPLSVPSFIGITASSGRILFAVHHRRSKEGQKKAFTTCSTHLTMVTFYCAPFVY